MTPNEKRLLKNLTLDGIPVDAKNWTEADWCDLHNAIERAKASIAKRHRRTGDCPYDKHTLRQII